MSQQCLRYICHLELQHTAVLHYQTTSDQPSNTFISLFGLSGNLWKQGNTWMDKCLWFKTPLANKSSSYEAFLSPALVHGLSLLSVVLMKLKLQLHKIQCLQSNNRRQLGPVGFVVEEAHLAEVNSAVFSAAARTIHTVLTGFAVFQVPRGWLGGREEAWWDEKTGNRWMWRVRWLLNCVSIL